MSELKLTLITFAICAVILVGAQAIFGATMIQFIVGMLLYLTIKREVKDWNENNRL